MNFDCLSLWSPWEPSLASLPSLGEDAHSAHCSTSQTPTSHLVINLHQLVLGGVSGRSLVIPGIHGGFGLSRVVREAPFKFMRWRPQGVPGDFLTNFMSEASDNLPSDWGGLWPLQSGHQGVTEQLTCANNQHASKGLWETKYQPHGADVRCPPKSSTVFKEDLLPVNCHLLFPRQLLSLSPGLTRELRVIIRGIEFCSLQWDCYITKPNLIGSSPFAHPLLAFECVAVLPPSVMVFLDALANWFLSSIAIPQNPSVKMNWSNILSNVKCKK